jgi:hypothetical protein
LRSAGPSENTDVRPTDPFHISREAVRSAGIPPGCSRVIGTTHRASAAAKAAPAATSLRKVSPLLRTGTRANGASRKTALWRNPVAKARTTAAATPWRVPGRARKARRMRRAQARASKA